MKWRFTLWPFAKVYGFAVTFRNFLFNKGWLRSEKFEIPIISIGNIITGGTGKTPHVEYLIRLLSNQYKVAVLSRGYGRQTRGYYEAGIDSKSRNVGDEPLQYKRKFPDVIVAVNENRVSGIDRLMQEHNPDVILLDDAFQHRYVHPSSNIILTGYSNPFFNDHLIPVGHLREPITGSVRADVIVVTKCPSGISKEKRLDFIHQLNLISNQQVFFSYIKYGQLVSLNHKREINPADFKKSCVLLVCGIADPSPFINYLQLHFRAVSKLIFPDHHTFTSSDINLISRKFDTIVADIKIIITTEKDIMRLENVPMLHLPFFYIPIEVDFIDTDKDNFNKYILNHVRTNKANS